MSKLRVSVFVPFLGAIVLSVMLCIGCDGSRSVDDSYTPPEPSKEEGWRAYVDETKKRIPKIAEEFSNKGSFMCDITIIKSGVPGEMVIDVTRSFDSPAGGKRENVEFECSFYESGGKWHSEGYRDPKTSNRLYIDPIDKLLGR